MSGTELANPGKKRPPLIRRLIKGFVAVSILAVISVALIVTALWLEHRTGVTLPAPTGPFAVGRAIYDWVDDRHADMWAPVAGTKRELLVWIWYPAASGPIVTTSVYLPTPLRTAIERARPAFITKLLTRDLSKVHTHSYPDRNLSLQQRSFPILIMRAGASAEVVNYSTLAEDLASHGYVVVGFDAPYRTGLVAFPDGRVIARTPENNPELCVGQEQQESCVSRVLAAWTADITFVLDRLDRLNSSDASGKFTGRL